jgi:hypothetical protein
MHKKSSKADANALPTKFSSVKYLILLCLIVNIMSVFVNGEPSENIFVDGKNQKVFMREL